MKHARVDYDHIQDSTGKIPEDEPVFLIRGQDVSGAAAVRHWAALNIANGGDESLTDAAVAHADLMDAWPIKKPADGPSKARPS